MKTKKIERNRNEINTFIEKVLAKRIIKRAANIGKNEFLDRFSEREFYNLFRFTKRQIIKLTKLLNIPENITQPNYKYKVSPIEALSIFLCRFSVPKRLFDIKKSGIGLSESRICRIALFTAQYIVDNFGNLLIIGKNSIPSTFYDDLQTNCELVGMPIDNVVAYIDCSHIVCCKPTKIKDDICYTGYKDARTLKIQVVLSCSGLVLDLHGPIAGSINDATQFSMSAVEKRFSKTFYSSKGEELFCYGDGAYSFANHMVTPFPKFLELNNNDQQDLVLINKVMSKHRVAIENFFNFYKTTFAYFDSKKKVKPILTYIGTIIRATIFMMNLKTILQGSQVSKKFKCKMPTLEEYISWNNVNSIE
ncbi:uncharacterized protein SCDLUD_001091 [Saccharomycodes ludwigii]|uniref:uncharacterized protein n=1 Tax=Saccharomycodes ludwigii TaxID=36035 RepID=UPI001E87BE2D|nr:hypothetical protein SCDLUD_003118 [Saccharomycodes ludwigii]XP_045937057.1 hypothetical protein SCDLUD_000742 [Saccharomycodes ludwigii]XP_045937379.1 hypothetical protein SCDLUD_001091 [Saccharomycodes ludwigii]KAH3900148.1 hypothetical protein SCDLUD_003118 [Saccharomycodes ludwigii]KAH3903129.1 hypothetical protein SCDLUD_000742 [Saccharomycodes ludwigii]KAH3903451.1 hypothetical protein SCDLUD_001091 [Saccharomycodes ludwigii]